MPKEKTLPSPRPMPVTGKPDRVDQDNQKDMSLKQGVLTAFGSMQINPGRKPN